MGKTCKGKDKAKAKVAAAKRKIARKCKGGKLAALLTAFALAFMFWGCASSESAQPAKSATMNNTFDECIIIVAAKAKLPLAGTNRVVEAEGGNMPNLELLTQTQSLESSGTESFAQTATQTPTTDVKPDIDVKYNDAIAAASSTSKGILETLTAAGAESVLAMMESKGSGQVTVEKKDGSKAVVTCENGQCTTCTDCTP